MTNKSKELKRMAGDRQDLGDPDAMKERDDVRKLINQQQLNDIRVLLSMPEGRRFFWRQLCEFRMFGAQFNLDDVNGRMDAHINGMRVCAKWLADELSGASRENYLLMWQENFGEML